MVRWGMGMGDGNGEWGWEFGMGVLGRGANKLEVLAAKWRFQPINHKKQTCKMFPNNNHGWGMGGRGGGLGGPMLTQYD